MKKSLKIGIILLLTGSRINAQTCATQTPLFNGASANTSYITLDSTFLGTSGTVEAWVYVNSMPTVNGAEIFTQSYSNGGTQTDFFINTSGHLVLDNYNGNWFTLTGVTTFTTNIWYHVAATWNTDGSNVTTKLYVNGCEDASNTSSRTWGTNTTYSVTIGAWQFNSNWGQKWALNGNMDDPRVWNVARTQCEIIENMKQLDGNSGLVRYFQFNETSLPATTTADYSGSHLAKLHNISTWQTSSAPVITDSPTFTNPYSLNFNISSSEYVSTSYTLSSSGTLEAWIYVNSMPTVNGAEIFTQSYSSGMTQTDLFINTNGHLVLDNYNGSWFSLTGATTFTTSTWYHVAAAWNTDGNNVTTKLYVNGCEDASNTSSRTWGGNTTYSLTIGAWQFNSAQGLNWAFNGYIDEVRIWGNAKMQSEIIENLHQTISGSPTGLSAYFEFDDGSGTTATNSISSSNGTLVNTPTWNSGIVAPINASCGSSKTDQQEHSIIDNNTFSIYPNPAKNEINISLKLNQNEKMTLNIYNVNGQLVITNNRLIKEENNTIKVDTNLLDSGIYFCALITGSETKYIKFVVTQ